MVTRAPGNAFTTTSPDFNGFPLQVFEALDSGRGRSGEILVSPGIGRLGRAPARKISELASLPGFFSRESSDHND